MRTRTYTLLAGLVAVACGAIVWHRATQRNEAKTPSRSANRGIDLTLLTPGDPAPTFGGAAMLSSQLCTQAQFDSERFSYWVNELHEPKRYHSKQWEYAFILQALSERGLLAHGKRGLGFGVGQEPLPSLFAKYGAAVLATDLDLEEATKEGWAQSGQHMTSIDVLNQRKLVADSVFASHVSVRNVDMNHIPDDLRGFDFTWSTCALGHLGNLDKGLAFIENSLATLKPNGIAVHTTEFNLSSNIDTYETTNTSVYRKRDIETLVARLTAEGHEVHVNYNFGSGDLDRRVDERPYTRDAHLKIRLGTFVVTSLGLIIRKNPDAADTRP